MTTVLHVIDTTGPGGAETVFVDLADRSRAQGFRSVAVLRGPGWVQDELRRRGLEPLMVPAKGSFNWRYLAALRSLIRRERVDVIQSHLLGSNVYCALAGWLTGRPVVATFHGMVDISPDERLRALKFWVMQRGVRRYVAVSEGLGREIASRGLLDPGRARVVHNGVDLAAAAVPRHRRLVEELGLPQDAVLAGSLGNVRPAKAYDVLIQGAAQLMQEFPRLHFVIAGDRKKELMPRLTALAEACGVAGRVHFLGFRQPATEFLAGLDLFVLSSTSEGFSIATIEAMAAGLPVVVTRSGGPEEIVEHERTGLLVQPGDPDALAEAIRRVMNDRDFAHDMAERGREAVATRFGLDAMLDAYTGLYRDLTAAGTGRAGKGVS